MKKTLAAITLAVGLSLAAPALAASASTTHKTPVSAHVHAAATALVHRHGHGKRADAHGSRAHSHAPHHVAGTRHRRGVTVPVAAVPPKTECPTHCVPKPTPPAGGWPCMHSHTCKPHKPHCPPKPPHSKPTKPGSHTRPATSHIEGHHAKPQPLPIVHTADVLPFTGMPGDVAPLTGAGLLALGGGSLLLFVGRRARARGAR